MYLALDLFTNCTLFSYTGETGVKTSSDSSDVSHALKANSLYRSKKAINCVRNC